jgi:hypothetical protein
VKNWSTALRIKMNATVDTARVRVVIDIGFGDAVEPGLTEMDLPVLLDFPAPHIRVYARETVIAEKFQAMVMLGRANSRMKDLYDIWVLSRASDFKGDSLARAIAATFARRKTEIPAELPDALPPAFAEDQAKVQQWNAFVGDVAFSTRHAGRRYERLGGLPDSARNPERWPPPVLGRRRRPARRQDENSPGVTLEDGETIHNAFFDRNFKDKAQ